MNKRSFKKFASSQGTLRFKKSAFLSEHHVDSIKQMKKYDIYTFKDLKILLSDYVIHS